jgi:heme/copper-type cytochrome/quinol oxidase subunit 2
LYVRRGWARNHCVILVWSSHHSHSWATEAIIEGRGRAEEDDMVVVALLMVVVVVFVVMVVVWEFARGKGKCQTIKSRTSEAAILRVPKSAGKE